MKRRFGILFLMTMVFQQLIVGQSETYSVEKTSFSLDRFDEFCPVYYKDGLVFSSNRSSGSFSNYSDSQGKGVFNIFYTENNDDGKWKRPGLLSKNITTRYNDGPSIFNRGHDTIYYSRNIGVEGKLKDNVHLRNKLGIFYASREGEEWTKIREMRINNEWYNVTTPYLSPDGTLLYFASDNPDGFGGMDLYYSERVDDFWNNPVNLGPNINTSGNEAYPFINQAGELLFSSDGHGGFGGKDIFFSRLIDSTWLNPIHLEGGINSKFDDFGIVTDQLMDEGYFSSNREGSVDIFHFRTMVPQIFYNEVQKENQYCFIFCDSGSIVIDTTLLEYKWSFSDGNTKSGMTVDHCFPGPGKYDVRLDIVDRTTGKYFFDKLGYTLELKDFEQAYINSVDAAIVGTEVEFDAIKSYLPGYTIVDYTWDFGDGVQGNGEENVHAYTEKGEYLVNLLLAIKSNKTNNITRAGISKWINVFENHSDEYIEALNKKAMSDVSCDIRNAEGLTISDWISAEDDFDLAALFRVELLSSKDQIRVDDALFSNIPVGYQVKEYFNNVDSTYSYVVDQQYDLMATYLTYNRFLDLGYRDISINLYVIKDPEQKELLNILNSTGAYVDKYFDGSYNLTSQAYIMLDQVVRLMNRYPELRLEVAVHTDSQGTGSTNLSLSGRRAQVFVDYLVDRGVNSNRLISIGYGEYKPIAPNYLEKDRRLNRRVEFSIVK